MVSVVVSVASALALALPGASSADDVVILQADEPSSSMAGDVAAIVGAQADFSGLVVSADADSINFAVSTVGRDAEDGDGFSVDDVWRYASVTKQFMATIAMQEVEAGRLSLTDTLGEKLPRFNVRGAKDVTIEQLMRHTSGLGEPDGLPDDDTVDPVAYCRVPRRLRPGRRFIYNNCDTVLLGAILEETTGKSWQTLLSERIYEPAGMDASGVFEPGAPSAETVAVYAAAGELEQGVDPAFFGASAAAYGSARDLVAFNQALVRGAYVGEEARETMWQGEPKFGYVALGVWGFPASLEGCDGSVRLVERRGDVGGVQVRNIIAPELDKSLVLFSNVAGVELGQIWTRSGFTYELVSASFCGG